MKTAERFAISGRFLQILMKRELIPQIREQMSGPDRLKFLAQNNPGFFHFIGVKKNFENIL